MPWLPFGMPQYRPPPTTKQGAVRMAQEIRCPKCGERQDMPDDLTTAPWCLSELLDSVTNSAK